MKNLFKIQALVLSLVLLLSTTTLSAQCPSPVHPDYDALMALYNSTDGPNWDDNTGWLDGAAGTNCDPCDGTWLGITCDANNRVKLLDLKYSSLSGTIPVELAQLQNLETLNFRNNDLTGSIPDELGQLQNLEYLNISGNDLSGSIPVELGQLQNLEDLYLAGNDLTGSIPVELGQLQNLIKLYLSSNSLSGSIPLELGQLQNLERLYLELNNLSGNIPMELGQLQNLEYLVLDNNNLSGNIPMELGQLQNLRSLLLNINNLSGSIPMELGQLQSLVDLNLGNNNLSGSIPVELGQLQSLWSLYLNNNSLSGSIPNELGQLQNLHFLDIASSNLSSSILAELGQLQNLIGLDLRNNNLSGNIPIELGQLQSLENLNLSNNNLSGSIPVELGQLENLNTLDLNNNNLSGCIPSAILDFCGIWSFWLYNNPLLPWEGSTTEFCASTGLSNDQIGMPCDDGDSATVNDVINSDCSCGGALLSDLLYFFNTYPYFDINSDNTFTEGIDFIIENQQFTNSYGASYFLSASGVGQTIIDSALTVDISHISTDFWTSNPMSISTAITPTLVNYDLYFAMTPDTIFDSLYIDISSSKIRCNSEVNYWLTIQNAGTTFSSETFDIILDDSLSYVSADVSPDAIAGNTLTFSFDSLPPTHSITYHLIVETPGVDALGDIMTVEVFSTDFSAIHEEELICSYDPNDKLVEPAGVYEDNYTSFEDSILTYTIRFQNTGNDTAFNVIVRDTISELLDMNSYHFIASSHDMTTEIDRDNGLISFHFENIHLPDSNVNEAGSHGFVKFQLEIIDGLDEGTPVENTAEIYFDQNPEIVTNTTLNTFATPPFGNSTSVSESFYESSIELFPNPASDILNIRIPKEIHLKPNASLQILDMQAKVLKSIDIQNNIELNVDVSELNKGMYMLMYSDGENQVMKKFVKI